MKVSLAFGQLSTTLQCLRIADHVTLNFNDNMWTSAVFLDVWQVFNTTWHSCLLHKLSDFEFLTNFIKLIASILTKRKFKFLVQGKFSTPREVAVGMPQGSLLAQCLQSVHKRYSPQHVELILTCLWMIPIFRGQRYSNVFSANCNATSLQ
jgi:hypothetical protein